MLTEFQKDFLEKIINIPSVGGTAEDNAPYGKKPTEVLDLFLKEAGKCGFSTVIVGDRAGWVEYGSGEKLLGIICHLDVVPVSDGWSTDPFTLAFDMDEEDGEVMYARGIVDDKGPACASFFAMKELLDEGEQPENYRIRLILGTDEERTCSCIQYYAAHEEIPDFSITPDSVFPVIFSEKRILQLRISGDNKSGLEAQGGSAVNIVPSDAYCIHKGKKITARGRAAHASKEVRKLTYIWERHMDKFAGFKEEYRRIHTEPKAVGVGTYARHIPNTIAFGIQAPWQTDQCHQADEHVAVKDFQQWIEIIKEYITEFTKE